METPEKKAIRVSLRVYRELREKLLKDTINKNTDLYSGLHNKEEIRPTYIGIYETRWMAEHLEYFKELVEKKDLRDRVCKELFAESYSQFLKENGHVYCGMDLTIDMLKKYQGILEEIIASSISWEQGYEEMCLLNIKFDEKYRMMKEDKII